MSINRMIAGVVATSALSVALVQPAWCQSSATACASTAHPKLGCLKSNYGTYLDSFAKLVPCPSGAQSGAYQPGTCYEVNVIGCPSAVYADNCQVSPPKGCLRDIKAVLKITEPTTGTLERGTILFLNGGSGTNLWEDGSFAGWVNSTNGDARYDPGPAEALSALNDWGFRTVQVFWEYQWFATDSLTFLATTLNIEQEGLRKLACRPATVFRWLHEKYIVPDPSFAFCATGNSAGASQIAYALDEYEQGLTGGGQLFDQVVLTSGPVFTTLWDNCHVPPGTTLPPPSCNTAGRLYAPSGKSDIDTAWGERDEVAAGVGICAAAEGGPDYTCPAPPPPGQSARTCKPPLSGPTSVQALLEAGSQLPPGISVPEFTRTLVTSLVAGDCTTGCCGAQQNCILGDEEHGSCASATEYLSALEGGADLLVDPLVTDPTMQHGFQARIRGAKRIRDALLRGCIPR